MATLGYAAEKYSCKKDISEAFKFIYHLDTGYMYKLKKPKTNKQNKNKTKNKENNNNN